MGERARGAARPARRGHQVGERLHERHAGRPVAGAEPLRAAPQQLQTGEQRHGVRAAAEEHEAQPAAGLLPRDQLLRAHEADALVDRHRALLHPPREPREERRADPQRAADAGGIERAHAAAAEDVLARPRAEALAVDRDLGRVLDAAEALPQRAQQLAVRAGRDRDLGRHSHVRLSKYWTTTQATSPRERNSSASTGTGFT